MLLFDLLKASEATFVPANAKVHLARPNGTDDPIDAFMQGNFDDWQARQSKRNFEKGFVVSLVQYRSPTRWLFAGLFRSNGSTGEPPNVVYSLRRMPSTEEWVGRLFVESRYKDRNSYPNGGTLEGDLTVTEVLRERVSIRFDGFKQVNLKKEELDYIVRNDIDSWRTALSHVKGIYLITDVSNGRLYVGKADGQDGIWGRWCTYAETGHGGNVALKQELGIEAPPERLAKFRFSILEIADLHATVDDINRREKHWKDALQTREHGNYNRN